MACTLVSLVDFLRSRRSTQSMRKKLATRSSNVFDSSIVFSWEESSSLHRDFSFNFYSMLFSIWTPMNSNPVNSGNLVNPHRLLSMFEQWKNVSFAFLQGSTHNDRANDCSQCVDVSRCRSTLKTFLSFFKTNSSDADRRQSDFQCSNGNERQFDRHDDDFVIG